MNKLYETTTLDATGILRGIKFYVAPKRYNGEFSDKEITWKLNLKNSILLLIFCIFGIICYKFILDLILQEVNLTGTTGFSERKTALICKEQQETMEQDFDLFDFALQNAAALEKNNVNNT